MSMKKRVIILVVLAVFGIICGLFFANYSVIGGTVISRDATHITLSGSRVPDVKSLKSLEQLETLDLREVSVGVSEYEILSEALPNCDILWKVPFQGEYVDHQVAEITVQTMTAEDIALLKYFPELKKVDATNCRDYDAILKLTQDRPDLDVEYSVELDNVLLRENDSVCYATNDNVRMLLSYLQYLPNLKTVNADACTDYETLMEIRAARPDLTVNYSVIIGGIPQAGDASVLMLDISDAAEALEKLEYFPNLTNVVFTGLASDHELMYAIKCRYPDAVIQWNFELFGVETSSIATELFLNEIPMESVEPVENALKYFYNLEWVEMCQCGIPSEEMDALWKRHPETRFVWAIPMGPGYVRTDVKAFIPYKYGYDIYNPFYDEEAKELKYLVDMECLDLGHMRMTDVSFLQYMPKLKFLILADVICEDFSYIADLTELVYIELFRSEFDDVELLMNLKKLEDLNIGWTNLKNPELLKEMTWLKRLWATRNGMNWDELVDLRDSMPDTLVYIGSAHPTEGGWRQSTRYYEMRDLLGMFYMK